MRSAIALVAVLGFALGVSAQDRKYESEDGRFKAAFPGGKPKESNKDSGNITMYTIGTEVKGRAFLVMYADFPDAVKQVPTKTLFDGAEKGAVKENGGKLLSSVDMTFGKDKLPAREILVKKDNNIIRTVMILNDTRLYLLIAGGPDSFATNKEVYGFFDSFEITK
jgi:hypothetical protein